MTFDAEERDRRANDVEIAAVGHREGRPDVYDPHAVVVLRDDGQETHSTTADDLALGDTLHRDHAANGRHQTPEMPLL